METIDPTPLDPSWSSPITTRIAPSKTEAIREAKEYESHSLCVFTDGSGYQEGIGAAAWASIRGEETSKAGGPIRKATLDPVHVKGRIRGLL